MKKHVVAIAGEVYSVLHWTVRITALESKLHHEESGHYPEAWSRVDKSPKLSYSGTIHGLTDYLISAELVDRYEALCGRDKPVTARAIASLPQGKLLSLALTISKRWANN